MTDVVCVSLSSWVILNEVSETTSALFVTLHILLLRYSSQSFVKPFSIMSERPTHVSRRNVRRHQITALQPSTDVLHMPVGMEWCPTLANVWGICRLYLEKSVRLLDQKGMVIGLQQHFSNAAVVEKGWRPSVLNDLEGAHMLKDIFCSSTTTMDALLQLKKFANSSARNGNHLHKGRSYKTLLKWSFRTSRLHFLMQCRWNLLRLMHTMSRNLQWPAPQPVGVLMESFACFQSVGK